MPAFESHFQQPLNGYVATDQCLIAEEIFYGVGLRHDDFILTIILWVPMLLVWQAGSGVGAWCLRSQNLNHRT